MFVIDLETELKNSKIKKYHRSDFHTLLITLYKIVPFAKCNCLNTVSHKINRCIQYMNAEEGKQQFLASLSTQKP